MGRRASSNPTYSNVVKVTDEAWIAQRAAQQRPTWYLFKLGDKWPRCSLGTADLREARSLALKAYQAWLEDAECDWRAACGNVSHHVSFKAVAEEWLATQKTDHAYKAGVVRKFLLPFFDAERSTTSMTMVTQAMVDDYKVWRRDFWLTRQKADNSTTVSDKQAENYREPSANTLNREYPTLRQILGYAAKKGYFEKQPVPVVEAENGSPNPRPAFLGDDFNVLMREVEKWIGEATDALTRQKRQLLADWVWVNRYTGLRVPHEAEKLTWADILDVLAAIAAFADFTPDNDPYGEHDCAVMTVGEHRIIWKIDYYDLDMNFASDDPANPAVTIRLMTIMLAKEY